MSKATKLMAVSVLGLSFTALGAPDAPTPIKEETPGLRAKAKVTPEAASKTALARVSGKIESQELEEEHGKLVYSFDIRAPKKLGVEEVQVDALTGQVVSVKHENGRAEAREKKGEKKEQWPTK